MKYVLDSSAALPWILPEALSPQANQLRDDYHNAIHKLIAPDIFPAEVFNSVLKAERMRRMSVGTTENLFLSIAADRPALHSYLPLMSRAGDIASRYRVALHDCLYMAFAEREACEVIRSDHGISSLQSQFPFIKPLSSL